MKKLLGMTVAIMLLSGLASAADFRIELKGQYFYPTEEAFRDVYGGGLMYGAEASIVVWRELEDWFGGSYFSKTGELTFTGEETKVKIVPLGVGLRYSYPVLEGIDLYGALGIHHYSYREENPLGEVSKGGIGYSVRIGSYVRVTGKLFIDLYGEYSYCKMKPADFEINIGGIGAGVGIAYEF